MTKIILVKKLLFLKKINKLLPFAKRLIILGLIKYL